MKRIVRPPGVVYIERHAGWSLLYISGCLGLILISAAFKAEGHDEAIPVSLAAAVIVGGVAMAALYRVRVFILDHEKGVLTYRERKALRKDREVQAEFSKVEVLVETWEKEHRYRGRGGVGRWQIHVTHHVFVEIRGEERLTLLRHGRGDLKSLLKTLEEDFRCRVGHEIKRV